MKRLVFATVLSLFHCLGYSQDRVGIESINISHFLNRQPSARAEAMGRGYVAVDNDLSAYYFNPAGLSTLSGLNFSSNYGTTNGFFLDGLQHQFYSVGVPIKNWGFFALSYVKSGWRDKIEITTVSNPEGTGKFITIQDEQYVVSFARPIVEGLHVGANLSYFKSQFSQTASTLLMDIGAMYLLELTKNDQFSDKFTLGMSLKNVTNSSYTYQYKTDESLGNGQGPNDRLPGYLETLPVKIPHVFRFGGSYSFDYSNQSNKQLYSHVAMLLNAEYHTVLNSKMFDSYHFGSEITFKKLVAFRLGFLRENHEKRDGVTYGLGLNLDLNRWASVPVNIKLDFCNSSMNLSDEAKSVAPNARIFSLQSTLVWQF